MDTSAPAPVAKSERRLARWLLLGLLLLITPVVMVGIGVASLFRLNRDAAMLKREVMAATEAGWNTKVQVSAGWCTLTAARTILRFVDDKNVEDARLALSAVRHASVGVYEQSGGGTWSRGRLIARTDERMQGRGWNRLAGITGENESVLIYTKDEAGDGDRLELCVAVVDGRDLVVVSTRVDAGTLLKLAEKHMPEGGFRGSMKKAGESI